ncbi:MAG: TIGR00730 family Rossman fold protein [Erysipelotrichaceae bacterium]|nr:TIGR00730 family Rossman fold protein [Erysipelotrichaceae bacterium]
MKIAVYCGSSAGKLSVYTQVANELGKAMGKGGDVLVYGGCNTGLMGSVADGVLAEGGKVIGVVPSVKEIEDRVHTGLSEKIETKDVSERKQVMMDLADAYIALPGGPGTLDETSDILCLARLGINKKPCVFYDVNDYYSAIRELFFKMIDSGFADPSDFDSVLISDDLEEIMEFVHKKIA